MHSTKVRLQLTVYSSSPESPELTLHLSGMMCPGHLSLVREARANNDVVLASIFVNPTQFGEGEDLDKYPRQFERDSEQLSELNVVSVLMIIFKFGVPFYLAFC